MKSHIRVVKPDFPVESDATGAAGGQTTPSGTLYAPQTKELAPVVQPDPPHTCNPPKVLSEDFDYKFASDEAEEELPAGTLFHCECGRWLERIVYHNAYGGYFSHYWHEVTRWDFNTKRRIRHIERQEQAKAIVDTISRIEDSNGI